MGFDDAAYRALGISSRANAATVEAAYRKLIKRYHPDRAGGDPDRAAEINWAYDHIRKARQLPHARHSGYPVVQPEPRRASSVRGRWTGLALLAGALVLVANADAVEQSLKRLGAEIAQPPVRSVSYEPAALAGGYSIDPAEQPLDSDAIDRSAQNALRLAHGGGLDRLASQSRRCHAELRRRPDLLRFDQCAAFDEAIIVLINSNVVDDGGEFSVSAVTGRQLAAARLFTDDYLTVESRLDRIRSRVEFALAPADPRPIPRAQH